MGDPYHDAGGGHMRPHRGTLILVLGIVSLVACQFLGIAAWIMGKGDLQEMAAGRMDPSGEGITNAGRILGIISVALTVVMVVVGVLAFVGMLFLGVAATP